MVGTRLDKLHDSVVRVEEMRHFERLYNIPLLLIGNKNPSKEQSGIKISQNPPAASAVADSPSSVTKQSLYSMSAFITQLCGYLLNGEQIKPLQISSIGTQI